VGIPSHVLHGVTALEGIRAYRSAPADELQLSRIASHQERLRHSAATSGMTLPHCVDELRQITTFFLARSVNRTEPCSDETFLTATAAEVTPGVEYRHVRYPVRHTARPA